ncbi:MAG: hypothetical protein HZA19_03020, partial [Nitrospirae bacterium]|nr:hypothetical protein [Nitrospirota bacterium]
MYKIAVVTPLHKEDYLANTILDGLDELAREGKVTVSISPSRYPSLFFQEQRTKSHEAFISFAQGSDAIFFLWGKDNTDWELPDRIGRWDRTVFIDGSEVGNNGRYDTSIQWEVLSGLYKRNGAIHEKMLKKCVLYFRREKPYLSGVIPLPFGIERGYRKYCLENPPKDIDFFCVFGQDQYPALRYYVREYLVQFCKKNGFSCFIEKTADRNEFYKFL